MDMGVFLFMKSFSLSGFLIMLLGYSCGIAPVIVVIIRRYLGKKREKQM